MQLFLEFQKEIEQEKVRRLQIMRQLEAERYRISMQKWVKDEGVDNCSSCSSEFSLFKRKVRTISVFSTLLSLVLSSTHFSANHFLCSTTVGPVEISSVTTAAPRQL